MHGTLQSQARLRNTTNTKFLCIDSILTLLIRSVLVNWQATKHMINKCEV